MASCGTNILLIFFSLPSYLCLSCHALDLDPTPSPWPPQFHSLLSMNDAKGAIQVADLWYDWPNGRNFNIIQNQLGKLLYDLEWNNGTSFYYTLDDATKECKVLSFPVGILPPDWLQGGTYVGQRVMDGFLCNVWEKVEFIVYYEDVARKIPVHWDFFNGMSTDVMTFEVGAVLEDAKWQAPAYCFNKAMEKNPVLESTVNLDGSHGALMKGVLSTATTYI